MQSNQLLDDNKNLVSFVNELKSENQQLSQLKNSIMTSIKSTSPVPSGNAKNIQVIFLIYSRILEHRRNNEK
jgi:hypothetical protein